ncbi:glycosyltransferase [Candidatus Daviesbacteria bacterium]|nr:glycosyltransferase [Candidatus Daviesbacteria bacterium]
MRIPKAIIYANFAPYDNAGNILDFFVENFLFVAHFSFQFHKLGKAKQKNTLTIYKRGQQAYRLTFFNLSVPESLLYFLLPITGTLFLLQLLWWIFLLRIRGNKFDYFFSVNALTAWLGIILKKIGIVNETIFWIWDYYPTQGNSLEVKIMRSLYWHLDKFGAQESTHTFFLSAKLQKIRKKFGLFPENKSHPVIPIGANVKPIKLMRKSIPTIGYLGVIKQSQGLDLLVDTLPKILKNLPDLKIEIVGSGPYEDKLKKRLKYYQKIVKFYGYIESLEKVTKIMKKWSIGVATYTPTTNNPAYFADPSKIKTYLSVGVPVICTNVTPFSNEINKSKAGIVVDYHDKANFIRSVGNLIKFQTKYSKSALKLARKYNYKRIYKNFFKNQNKLSSIM